MARLSSTIPGPLNSPAHAWYCSISGGDFEPGYDTYTEKPGYSWDADIAFADVNPTDYAALVIPGGRAPEYIRNDLACQKIVRHFFENQKPVAHLCHAGLVLAACAALKGRRSAAYPALEPDIKAARAEMSMPRQWLTEQWSQHALGPMSRTSH